MAVEPELDRTFLFFFLSCFGLSWFVQELLGGDGHVIWHFLGGLDDDGVVAIILNAAVVFSYL